MLENGSNLSSEAKKEVLASFIYRATRENLGFWWDVSRPTDEDWLASHYFYVRKDGRLDRRYKHCIGRIEAK